MRKDKLLFLFITSMRPLLESGLLIEEALNMLSSQSSNRNIREISLNLLKSIKQGESLEHSLLSSSLKVPISFESCFDLIFTELVAVVCSLLL